MVKKFKLKWNQLKKSRNYICRSDIDPISLIFFVSLLTEVFYKKPYTDSTLKEITDKKWINNYQYLGVIILTNT